STHAISGGGYVAGVTREVDNDVTPAGVTNGSLWGSADGVSWSQMLTVPRLNANDDVRVDVYWELATGELVVNVKDAAGFGVDGRGYLLVLPSRQ
ncbi:MAG TPA: exo-alpha-sialidase, partial [Myxococcales bacterium]